MSSSPLAAERTWNRLLDLIERQQVVPLVGNDLITLEDARGVRPVEALLAERVAEALDAHIDPIPQSLNEVAYRLIRLRGRDALRGLYEEVYEQLSHLPPTTPPALRALASIRPFQLFVTTTVDPLLARAVQEQRIPGSTPVTVQSFDLSGGERRDLPAPLAELTAPVVYHLFGRASRVMDYAVTEEDTLEYVHALQSPTRQPPLLFDELRRRSVLLLGNGFPDWLVRFVLRVARRDRFMHLRTQPDVIADRRIHADNSLALFLQHYSDGTLVHPLGAREFVNELAERWKARDIATSGQGLPGRSGGGEGSVSHPEMAEHSVFISYASEARDSARRVADALRRAGLPVWFDERQLEPGDEYERRINDRIRSCSLFVPVLTRHVLASADPEARGRWFRREWKAATDRLPEFFGMERPFIVPCRVDDIDPQGDGIPHEFRSRHIADVANDESLTTFAAHLRELFKQYRLLRAPA